MVYIISAAQVLSEGAFGFDYLSMTNYPATLNPANIKVNFQFDEGTDELEDRSGNGHTLSLIVGTKEYTKIGNTKLLSFCDPSGGPTKYTAAPNANSQILGALTVEVVTFIPVYHEFVIIYCDGGDEIETKNMLYHIGSNVLSDKYFAVGHEHGAGINDNTSIGLIPFAETSLIQQTRSSDGKTYKMYTNGIFSGSHTFANAPTGGSLSNIGLGAYALNDFRFFGGTNSVRIWNIEMTSEQCLESYNNLIFR